MELTPFTVVAGLNASGKSNLFDALELLSRLASMSLREAFPERRGSVAELFTSIDEDIYLDRMQFEVDLLVSRQVRDNWGQSAEIKSPRLRYELHIERRKNQHGFEELYVAHERLSKIPANKDNWATKYMPRNRADLWKSTQAGGTAKPFIETGSQGNVRTIYIRQDGKQGGKATPAHAVNQTVLAQVNSVDFPHVFAAKEEMRHWRFMQLSPDDLRCPTIQDPKMSYRITHSGANLASALYRIKSEDPDALPEVSRQMARFLPEYVGVDVIDDEANKQFILKLRHKDGKVFSSRVLSEGTLRLLALTIMQQDPEHQSLLCFEEPENGIHPMRIGQMAQLLRALSADFELLDGSLRQVIVNTHSPLLVREMLRMKDDPAVGLWLFKMATLITDAGGRRVQIKHSTANPIQLHPDTTTPLYGPAALTAADLANYLSTLDEDPSVAGTALFQTR
ncbi:MAG: AAA family ATPase [Bacteroidia bacterium]